MMEEDLPRVIGFGASVVGQRHLSEGLSNQDAWLQTRGRFGFLQVVCDGLGSKKLAALGAKAATHAVREAVSRWHKAKFAPPNALIPLIELYWRLRVVPHPITDCATTCMFVLVLPNGEIQIGALGDGLALLENQKGVKVIHQARSEAFANQTDHLGASHSRGQWTLEQHQISEIKTIMLMTDGIADDLLPDKHHEFVEWVRQKVQGVRPQAGNARLRNALNAWATPKSGDDKTLTILEIGAKNE